jgi:hypothetical protein
MNGANGHQKAFELTPPKTAEEIHRESVNRAMPELRRNCSKDPRLRKCVGAKWLFGQLTDLSFLNNYGGDGHGKIYISVRDLSRIFLHDPHTLTAWRDKLIETGWIWVREMWPKSEWGITGVCRQPDLFPVGSEYTRTVAKASGRDSHGLVEPGKCEDLKGNGSTNGIANVAEPHAQGVPATSPVSTLYTDGVNPSYTFGGDVHTPNGNGTPAASVPAAAADGSKPSGSGDSYSQLKESPMEKGSSGANGGVRPALPIPQFEPLDRTEFMGKRPTQGEQQINYCKEKIRIITETRTPAPNAADVVAVYRARIKEIRKWMAGEK